MPGPYQIQAAISAVHCEAESFEATDRQQITALYDELAGLTPGPMVDLNRAVAVGMAQGPGAGLEMLARLEEVLAGDHRWHAAKAVVSGAARSVDLEGDRRATEGP